MLSSKKTVYKWKTWKVPSSYHTLLLPKCLNACSVANIRIQSLFSDALSVMRNWSSLEDFCHSSGRKPFRRNDVWWKKIDLTIATECRTWLFFLTKHRTQRNVASTKCHMWPIVVLAKWFSTNRCAPAKTYGYENIYNMLKKCTYPDLC